MGRYLFVANLTAESPELANRVRRVVASDPDAEFVVLVPTQPLPPVLSLTGLVEIRPLRLGRRRGRRARRRLEAAGARVSAVCLSMREPLDAIEDELHWRRYRAVVIATLRHPILRRLRRDVPGLVARRHPDLDVLQVTAPTPLHEVQIGQDAHAAPVDGSR